MTPSPRSEMETITYKTVDGLDIQADVYTPAKSGRRPLLVYVHGGTLMYGTRDELLAGHRDRYIEAGYVVASIDYRLAPETKLPGIIEDLTDAIRYLCERGGERFGIDPARLAVLGGSAGGYLTLMAGQCAEPKPRALVALYGYGDITADWYGKPAPFYCKMDPVSREASSIDIDSPPVAQPGQRTVDRGKLYLYCRQQGLWANIVGGRDPHTEGDFFIPYCPARNVTPDYPPTLLLHGDADTDVPHGQSVQMAAALAAAGVEHEFITIPDGPHGFDRNPDNPGAAEAIETILAFLARHLA